MDEVVERITFEQTDRVWTVTQKYDDGSELSYGAEDTFDAAFIQYLARNGYITPLVERMHPDDITALADVLDALYHVLHRTATRLFDAMYEE